MEGRGACAISTALVTESPGLTWASNPRVDLNHLATCQQISSLEQDSILLCASSIVATVGTGVLFGACSIGEVVVVAEVTVTAIAVELTRDAFARTLTETSTMTTVGTSHVLGPLVSRGGVGTQVTVAIVTLVSLGLTSVTGCGG